MLERLEQIDWSRLKAYGPGDEIPAMILALAPADPGAADYTARREAALAKLAAEDDAIREAFDLETVTSREAAAREIVSSNCCNIYHQGDLYEATPVTIPFLIELLKHPD